MKQLCIEWECSFLEPINEDEEDDESTLFYQRESDSDATISFGSGHEGTVDKDVFERIWKGIITLNFPKLLEEIEYNCGCDGAVLCISIGDWANGIVIRLWSPDEDDFRESGATESAKLMHLVNEILSLEPKQP